MPWDAEGDGILSFLRRAAPVQIQQGRPGLSGVDGFRLDPDMVVLQGCLGIRKEAPSRPSFDGQRPL